MRVPKRIRTRAIRGAAAVAALLLAAGTTEVQAQARGPVFGLEASINYGFIGGDDLDFLDSGIGFEAIGSLAWPSGLELGAGAGISSHDVDPGDEDADMTNLFAEARYRFNVPADEIRHLHPYVAGRVGLTDLSIESESDGIEIEADTDGLLLGLGGGLEYWLSESVGLDAAGVLHFLNYDNDVNGTKVDLRGGVKVRF